jgi:hypothetical protein
MHTTPSGVCRCLCDVLPQQQKHPRTPDCRVEEASFGHKLLVAHISKSTACSAVHIVSVTDCMSRSVLDTAGRDRHTTVLQRAWQVCCIANSCTGLNAAYMPVLTLPTSDTPASALQGPLTTHAVLCRPARGWHMCACVLHSICPAPAPGRDTECKAEPNFGRQLVPSSNESH